jgi:hypothetical protein
VKPLNIIWVHELCLPTKKIIAGLRRKYGFGLKDYCDQIENSMERINMWV